MEIRNLLKIKKFTPPILLALAACSGEVDNPLADGPVPLGVTAEIGQVMTRVQVTSFETNDAIGVVPEQTAETTGAVTQYPFSYDGSRFNPGDARYYFADTDEKTFHAYYPYTETWGADNTITLDTRAANQVSTKTGSGVAWRKNDYLAATATASASKPTASYTGDHAFRHVMAQVVITFQAGGGVSDLSSLTSYTLTTPLAMDGTFSPATGTVTVDESKDKEMLRMAHITGMAAIPNPSTLLLLPQSVEGGQLGLDVTYNKQAYRAALTLPGEGNLVAGTSYAYTVTISQNGLSVDKAEIQDWTPAETEGAETRPVPFGDKPLAEADWGDFYFSDGTLADKGAELTPEQAGACIGIVFEKGQRYDDYSDYSETGIQQERCHGYVVALTDVRWNPRDSNWAYRAAESVEVPGASGDGKDGSGYARTQAIREYAEAKYGTAAPDYFPAAYACLQYGTEKGYSLALRFAAPSSSSGWFLPAVRQLQNMRGRKAILQSSFEKLKEEPSVLLPDSWLSDSFYYWSSTQSDADLAWAVTGVKGEASTYIPQEDLKRPSNHISTRAVLAF